MGLFSVFASEKMSRDYTFEKKAKSSVKVNAIPVLVFTDCKGI